MTVSRTYFLVCVLAASAICRAEAAPAGQLTSAQYRAALDRLLSACDELNSSEGSVPEVLRHLPPSWRVQSGPQDFEISTEGLQRDVRRYDGEKSAANAMAIRRRLEHLERALDGFEKPPADDSAGRAELKSILSNREFQDVRGPNWRDRLKQRLLEAMFRFLKRIFRSVAIPTISKFVVYGLMGMAVLALLYIAYRSFGRREEFAGVVPTDLPVSGKEWAIWLAEARAAAARNEWRNAIHLAYWAGISFLERQGFWKPDRARTPREYLRLFSGGNEQRATLVALTGIFELAWYAKRDASERTFSQALNELEKLGCR
jgi:Domain of unknown function (DUF4129)